MFHIPTSPTEKQEYSKNKKIILPVATHKTGLAAALI